MSVEAFTAWWMIGICFPALLLAWVEIRLVSKSLREANQELERLRKPWVAAFDSSPSHGRN